MEQHKIKIQIISDLMKRYFSSDKKTKLRFKHGGSNSTRPKDKNQTYINISNLNNVVEVNVNEKYALVEPGVSMEDLVKVTSNYNLLPQVVMEFPKITCGGAINGASLESSSFKYGQLSDTCEEYEIILANGDIITASKEINQDLFYGISGSYGSLGVLSLIKINLVEYKKYVEVTYYPTYSFKETLELINAKILENNIDYLDAILYSKTAGVVVVAKRADIATNPISTYYKNIDLWFYEKGKEVCDSKSLKQETLLIKDYLFRYDRGAFWMGEYAFPLLGIPNNKLTRFLFNYYAQTHKLFEALQTLNVSQNYFLQDIYFPINKTLDCLEYNENNLGVYPIWLCPVKPTKTPQMLSPHCIDDDMLIDVGIWGQTQKYLSNPIQINKDFESFAVIKDARKMLYAHAYYSEQEFWNIYDKSWYDNLRKKYKADNIFPDVWQKTHVKGAIKGSRYLGFFKYFFINPIKNKFGM